MYTCDTIWHQKFCYHSEPRDRKFGPTFSARHNFPLNQGGRPIGLKTLNNSNNNEIRGGGLQLVFLTYLKFPHGSGNWDGNRMKMSYMLGKGTGAEAGFAFPTVGQRWIKTNIARDLLGVSMLKTSLSSILAWRIPWTEEPGRLYYSPWGCRVGHDWATKAFTPNLKISWLSFQWGWSILCHSLHCWNFVFVGNKPRSTVSGPSGFWEVTVGLVESWKCSG